MIDVRPLRHDDLAAALALQAEVYPAFLVEDAAAFASRIEVAHSYCLAATRDDALIGYLLAHGWPGCSPPPVGMVLARDTASEVLYLHDLAIDPAARSLGVGRKLVARAFELAAADGLRRAELVAVEGAAPYWAALGFARAPLGPPLDRKVAAYGRTAQWMERPIGPSAPL